MRIRQQANLKNTEEIFRRLPKVKGVEDWYDYDQALAVAKRLRKPLFIDFTGWNCVNCRQMEQNVLPDPEVLKRLENDFVVVQMVIDDKTELPVGEQVISRYNGKKVTTVGGRNLDMEISVFGSNAQPYYVLTDDTGKLLVEPKGSTTNIQEFKAYLDIGINAFKRKH